MPVVVVVGVLVVEDSPYRFSQMLTTFFDVELTWFVIAQGWLLETRIELLHPIPVYLVAIDLGSLHSLLPIDFVPSLLYEPRRSYDPIGPMLHPKVSGQVNLSSVSVSVWIEA